MHLLRYARTFFLFVGVNLAAAWLLSGDALAERDYATAVRPGIYFNQQTNGRFSATEKERLLMSLRRITGWTQLHINENGHLTLDRADEFVAGAAWARQVLAGAIRSGHRFLVENHAHSLTVNFGQLDEGTTYEDVAAGIKLTIYRLRLDGADFQQMEAPAELRATFDEGFTFFHELLHGLGFRDTNIPNEIGACEKIVNQIRAELGLPLRDHYLGETVIATVQFKVIRLRFQRALPATVGSRRKKQYLFFLIQAAPSAATVASASRSVRTKADGNFASLAD